MSMENKQVNREGESSDAKYSDARKNRTTGWRASSYVHRPFRHCRDGNEAHRSRCDYDANRYPGCSDASLRHRERGVLTQASSMFRSFVVIAAIRVCLPRTDARGHAPSEAVSIRDERSHGENNNSAGQNSTHGVGLRLADTAYLSQRRYRTSASDELSAPGCALQKRLNDERDRL